MAKRIAIATKDGKVVTDHFGHCRNYSIVEIKKDDFFFVGNREVIPPCNGREHTMEAILEVIECIKDCNIVIVNQIGGGAKKILDDNQIHVYEYKGYIKDALNNLLNKGEVVNG